MIEKKLKNYGNMKETKSLLIVANDYKIPIRIGTVFYNICTISDTYNKI
jgi:hypothetical protein